MTLKHVGIRPEYPTVDISSKKTFLHFERLPCGGGRYWNKKLLESGCGQVIEDIQFLDDLIFCPQCDEYIHRKQFQEMESE